MDTAAISGLPDSVKVLLIFAAAWLFNQWWQDRKDKDKSQSEALNKCTIAIVSLEVQIKNLTEILSILPKMRADIDAAHFKIRESNEQTKNNI